LSSPYGSAYLFARHQDGVDQWGQVAKVVPSDATANDFGRALSLRQDTLVVGASSFTNGAAHVFQRDEGGPGRWGEVTVLTPTSPTGGFGDAVALDGDTLVVGAAGGDVAFLFRRNHGGTDNWGQVTLLSAPADGFGSSASISSGVAAIGAVYDNTIGSLAGAVFVFAAGD
jgi:hypothetical protein